MKRRIPNPDFLRKARSQEFEWVLNAPLCNIDIDRTDHSFRCLEQEHGGQR